MFKSNFLNEISARGFIYQATDIEDLDNLMNQKNITAYIGFDITSDSLHIGSLVELMLLNLLDEFDQKTMRWVSKNDPKTYSKIYKGNVLISKNLIDSIICSKIKCKFIFAGSSLMFGINKKNVWRIFFKKV